MSEEKEEKKPPRPLNRQQARIIQTALAPVFEEAFGKEAFMKYFMGEFNDNTLLQQNDFNRGAQSFLPVAFMAAALGRLLEQSASIEGERDWKGKESEPDMGAIIEHLNKVVEEMPSKFDQEHSKNDGNEPLIAAE